MNTRMLFPSIAAVLVLSGHVLAQQYTFISFDVRCPAEAEPSACPAGLAPGQVASQTSARGINPRGDVVGSYVAAGRQHGFVLSDGQYTSLDFPVPGVRATIANGINARGEIVGQYSAPVHDPADPPSEDSPEYCPAASDPACIKGFHYRHGTFRTVMFPSTVDADGHTRAHPGAIAQRITADGDIYGCVHGHDLGASMFGAAWTRAGTFSLMGNGGQLSDPMAVPMSMNNGGTPGGLTIVGFFMDMANRQRGYVVRDGMLEPYDPTNATTLTAVWDINAGGQFVGAFRESGEVAAKRHAFLQNPDGSPALSLDFECQDTGGCAGASLGTVAFATTAFGINPDGVIVGQYTLTSGGAAHGFIAIPPSR